MPFSVPERLGRVEERMDDAEEKLSDVAKDIKLMTNDVSEIKQMLARYQGASNVIKYISHALAGIAGALLSLFSFKH